MQVSNSEWLLVGDGTDQNLVMQNVGTTRIAFVFAAAKPADGGITLDSDEHFMMNPGSEPLTVSGLNTFSRNVYARSLGPKVGLLAVEANTAP